MSFDLNVKVNVRPNIDDPNLANLLKDYMKLGGGQLISEGNSETLLNISMRMEGEAAEKIEAIRSFLEEKGITTVEFDILDEEAPAPEIEEPVEDETVYKEGEVEMNPADDEAIEYAGGEDNGIEDVMPEEINSLEEPETADATVEDGEDLEENEEEK